MSDLHTKLETQEIFAQAESTQGESEAVSHQKSLVNKCHKLD
jgi:hypothetical protein